MAVGVDDAEGFAGFDGFADLLEMGERLLNKGDIVVLDPEAIHAISNPLPTNSSAIHVYGGDLVERPERSLWNPDTFDREDYEITRLIEYVKVMSSSP